MARHFRPQSMDLFARLGSTAWMSQDLTENSEKPKEDPNQSYESNPTKPRVRTPIPFSKQLARWDSFSTRDVHPMRFVSKNTSPGISSNVRRIQTPDLKKQRSRRDDKSIKNKSKETEYSPNYNYVRRRTITGLTFNQLPERKFSLSFHSTEANSVSSTNPVNFASIDPKQKAPTIGKDASRPEHDLLPSHMILATHRHGLRVMSFKTLQMNAYMNETMKETQPPVKYKPIRRNIKRLVNYIKKHS